MTLVDRESSSLVTTIVPLLTIVIPLFGAAIAWILNEWRKRVWEDYQRREANYRELLIAMRGFYGSTDNDLKNKFLEQINICWLYCPDEVIRKAYDFLVKVEHNAEDKERAAGEFVLAVREDLFSMSFRKKSDLKPEDFKHYLSR
jgi:hypothetical protein